MFLGVVPLQGVIWEVHVLRAISLSGTLCNMKYLVSIVYVPRTSLFSRLVPTHAMSFVLCYYPRVLMGTANHTVNLLSPYAFAMCTLVFSELLRKMLCQILIRLWNRRTA
jgi:hypothetical protein